MYAQRLGWNKWARLDCNDVMAYITMMCIRLVEMRRVLKNTGSIYLYCDPTASHYLKILMDTIFDKKNFRNEIVWKRTSGHSDARCFGRVHDTILFYSTRYCSIQREKTLNGKLPINPVTKRPIVVWACGSRSIIKLFLPSSARPVARFNDVVVLPVPPFWLITAIIFFITSL